MNVEDLRSQASDAWETCMRKLSPGLSAKLMVVRGDPEVLEKGRKPVRLRIAPRKKIPDRFWQHGWTNYELLIGNLETEPGEGLPLGSVAFIQHPNRKACGSGFYTRATADLLGAAMVDRAADFRLRIADGISRDCTSLTRRYYVKEFRSFPAETAGEDLAWLIASTLPRIEQLPNAPECP